MPANGTVDERIVEMRIDHQKFESGAKKTISILEKLDLGLKALGKNNTDGFDGIAASLDKVTNKISVFGTIGDQVIRTLTNKAMELVSQMGKLANTLTIDQVGAGWQKYAEKTQGVQTIMAATAKDWQDQGAQMEWVNEQLEKLNWFTDETSYNFLDMVNNIGKFTSAGVKLEPSVTAMEGISTWAALSGANAQEASRAMYNLSQAMATGTVKLIDWKSIENANMATLEFKETALQTAVALGTLEDAGQGVYKVIGKDTEDAYFTAEKFNTTLSEGWFTSDVLIKTLDQYGSFTDALNEETTKLVITATGFLSAMEAFKEGNMDEVEKIAHRADLSVEALIPSLRRLSDEQFDLGYRAFKAAQEAKTFQEAIDATKDAVSTGWMNIWETIFGGYLEAKELWTGLAETLYNVFAEPVNMLIDLVDRAFKFNGVEENIVEPASELDSRLQEAGYSMAKFSRAFADVDPNLYGNLIEQYKTLDEAFKAGAIDAETFRLVLEKMAENDANPETKYGTVEYEKNGEKVVETAELVGEKVEHSEAEIILFDRLVNESADLLDKWAASADGAAEEKPLGGKMFRESLMTLMDAINEFTGAFSKALDLVFGGTDEEGNIIPWTTVAGDKLYSLLKRFHDFTSSLKFTKEDIENLSEKIAESIERVRSVGSVFKSAFSIVSSFISPLIGAVKQSGILGSTFRSLLNIIEALLSPLDILVRYLSAAFKAQESAGNMTWPERLVSGLSKVGSFMEKISARFKEFMQSETTVAFIADVINKLSTAFSKLYSFLQPIFSKALTFFSQIAKLSALGFDRSGFVGVFENLHTYIKIFLADHPVLSNMLNTLLNIGEALFNVFQGLASPIKIVFNIISNLFTALVGQSSGISGHSWIETLSDTFLKLSEHIKNASEKFKTFMQGLENKDWSLDSILGALNLKKDSKKTVFSGLFEGLSFENIWESIKTLATRIGEIFFAVFSNLFSEDGPLSKIKKYIGPAILTLIGLGIYRGIRKVNGVISGVGDVVENISKITKKAAKGPSKFRQFATTILMIAASIGIIAAAFVGIAKLNIKQLITGIIGIGVIIGLLVGMSRLAKSVKAKGFGKFILLAISVMLLAATLKGLAGLSWANLAKGIVGMLAIMATLIGMSRLAKSVKAKGFGKFILLAISVMLLAATLKGLAGLSWADLAKGIVGMLAIMATLIGMSRLAKSVKAKGFGQFILLAVSVMLLAATLKGLASLKPDQLATGIVGMIAIMATLIGMSRLAKSVKAKGFGQFILLAISVMLLAATLKGLASLKPDQLATGIVGMIAIMAMLVGMSRLTKSVKAKGFGQFILLAISVMLLAATLKGLAGLSWADLAKGIVGMLAIMATLIGMSRLAKSVKAKGFGQFILLAVSVMLLAATLKGLASLKPDQLATGIVGMIAIMAMLVGMSRLTKSVKAKGFGQLILIALAAVVLAGALAILAQYSWQSLLAAAAALAVGVISLTVLAFLVRALASVSIGTMLKGLAVMAVIVFGIALIIWGLIELGSSIVDSAIKLAEKLAQFAESLKPFAESISGFSDADSSNFDRFADMMLSIMVAEFWTMIASWLSKLGNSEALASSLTSFMEGIKPFLTDVTAVTEESVEGAKRLTSMMGSLVGGQAFAVVGSWLDGLDENYASTLSAFMSNLSGFLDSVPLVTQESVDGATRLTSMMGSLVGGQFWADIGTMFDGLNADSGQKLSDFMNGIKGFLESIGSVDESKLSGASNLTSIMRSAFGANFWSAIGSWFSGDNAAYAEKMSSFTSALVPFLNNIASIDQNLLSNARQALTTISVWNQDNTIANFGSQIDSFYKKINGKNAEGDLTGLQQAISMLNEFADAVVKISTVDGTQTGLDAIDSIGTGVKAGESTLTLALIITIQNAVNGSSGGAYDAAYSNGIGIANGVAAGINDSSYVAIGAAVSLASSINNAFASALDIHSPSRVFAALAAYIPAGIAQGIEENSGTAEDSITILASGVVAAMQQAMARVAMIADENFEISPRITPVVDMSNLTSAAGSANSMFGSIGTMMRGSIRASTQAVQTTAGSMEHTSYNNTVVSEIEALSGKLDRLGEAITGMQIVLDSGALVGATSHKMDNAFGVMQARKGRGN